MSKITASLLQGILIVYEIANEVCASLIEHNFSSVLQGAILVYELTSEVFLSVVGHYVSIRNNRRKKF